MFLVTNENMGLCLYIYEPGPDNRMQTSAPQQPVKDLPQHPTAADDCQSCKNMNGQGGSPFILWQRSNFGLALSCRSMKRKGGQPFHTFAVFIFHYTHARTHTEPELPNFEWQYKQAACSYFGRSKFGNRCLNGHAVESIRFYGTYEPPLFQGLSYKYIIQ